MTRNQAIKVLRENFDRIRTEYPVKSLSIFGSTARDEAGPDSDVDVLVEFTEIVSLFELAGLKLDLEELLGCRVDVVTANGLRRNHREEILKEAVRAA